MLRCRDGRVRFARCSGELVRRRGGGRTNRTPEPCDSPGFRSRSAVRLRLILHVRSHATRRDAAFRPYGLFRRAERDTRDSNPLFSWVEARCRTVSACVPGDAPPPGGCRVAKRGSQSGVEPLLRPGSLSRLRSLSRRLSAPGSPFTPQPLLEPPGGVTGNFLLFLRAPGIPFTHRGPDRVRTGGLRADNALLYH